MFDLKCCQTGATGKPFIGTRGSWDWPAHALLIATHSGFRYFWAGIIPEILRFATYRPCLQGIYPPLIIWFYGRCLYKYDGIMAKTLPFRTAYFLTSAPDLAHCPPEIGAEVAFAGRSNAGKSSAINQLTGNKKLARTSKTPGRTQLINFFGLETEDLRLVDLPGYGYAKVPMATKLKWQENLAEYLHQRQSLRGLILLMDIRHPLQDFDTMLLDWSRQSHMPVHVLLTKCDKLKRGAAQNALLQVRRHLHTWNAQELATVQTFSALNGEGCDILEAQLTRWLTEPATTITQTPQT